MQTLYAHMFSHQPLVKTGDRVKRGQPIGATATTATPPAPTFILKSKSEADPSTPSRSWHIKLKR
ncbi:M23 family metallopeptidase [Kroppenstedtia eburnea]|uniref:M23 family metallopeptidase n=1 Tax=Kroppenstedtia eburnea TaxID=714067 RepID=UPI0036342D08